MHFKEPSRLKVLLFCSFGRPIKRTNRKRGPEAYFYPVARELAPAGLRSGPQPDTTGYQIDRVAAFGAAAQPSGSKLPRHT